jgi:iron complex outermembrane recepter protein
MGRIDTLQGEALADYHSNNGLATLSIGAGMEKKQSSFYVRGSVKTAHDYRSPADGFVFNTGFREKHLSGLYQIKRSWGELSVNGSLYQNLQEIPDGSRDSSTRKFTRQIFESAQDDIRSRPLVEQHEFQTYGLSDLHQQIDHIRLMSTGYVHTNFGQLRAMIGVQQNQRREFNHPTMPDQPGLNLQLRTINYDFSLSRVLPKSLSLTTGINGMAQFNRHAAATDFPIPDYRLFDIGIFSLLRWSGKKTDIAGGLRYDSRHYGWKNFYIDRDPVTGFDKRSGASGSAELRFPGFSKYFGGISSSLGVSHKISTALLLKANVARGFRAPNITEVGSNGLDPGAHIVYIGNRNFKSEFSTQVDLSLSFSKKTISGSIEFFGNKVSNYIYQSKVFNPDGTALEIVPGNATYQYQQSAAMLYGAEASISLSPRPIPCLNFQYNAAFVRGLNRSTELRSRYGDEAKFLPLIPPMRQMLRMTFTTPDSWRMPKVILAADADINHAQRKFYAVDGSEAPTPGYVLFNTNLGIIWRGRDSRERLCTTIAVSNIANLAYQSHISRLKYFEYYAAQPGRSGGLYNMGRDLSLRITYPF